MQRKTLIVSISSLGAAALVAVAVFATGPGGALRPRKMGRRPWLGRPAGRACRAHLHRPARRPHRRCDPLRRGVRELHPGADGIVERAYDSRPQRQREDRPSLRHGRRRGQPVAGAATPRPGRTCAHHRARRAAGGEARIRRSLRQAQRRAARADRRTARPQGPLPALSAIPPQRTAGAVPTAPAPV